MSNKKGTSAVTWIVTIVFVCLGFYITYTFFSGETPFESRSSKCKTEAQERAQKLLRTKIAILEDKSSPTQEDKNTLEEYKSWIAHNAYSRDDYDRAYEDCMR